jgi:hypothetical protein
MASQDRMQALIDLVTRHALSEHFEQVFFISHNSALDLAMFKYHLYIDNGLVMECSLPAVTAMQQQALSSIPTLIGTNGYSDNEDVVEPQVMPL